MVFHQKLSISNVYSLQKLKKEQSCYDIDKVARFLPVNVDITMLSDEWKLLRLENLTYVSGQKIDHF